MRYLTSLLAALVLATVSLAGDTEYIPDDAAPNDTFGMSGSLGTELTLGSLYNAKKIAVDPPWQRYYVSPDAGGDLAVVGVDTNPGTISQPRLSFDNWKSAAQRGRVYRGLTSSGKKSRGLRRKGKGAEKIRPSLRARDHLAH